MDTGLSKIEFGEFDVLGLVGLVLDQCSSMINNGKLMDRIEDLFENICNMIFGIYYVCIYILFS